MGKVMRHTLGASLNIRHNLSSSKGPKPLQLKLLTTYIPKTSAFTLAFSTSQRLRTTRASARTGRQIAINGHIKFNLTIPLQQLNGLETLVIIMVANKYAFLQITRRRFLNEWEAFKKVISRRNIRRRI